MYRIILTSVPLGTKYWLKNYLDWFFRAVGTEPLRMAAIRRQMLYLRHNKALFLPATNIGVPNGTVNTI